MIYIFAHWPACLVNNSARELGKCLAANKDEERSSVGFEVTMCCTARASFIIRYYFDIKAARCAAFNVLRIWCGQDAGKSLKAWASPAGKSAPFVPYILHEYQS